MTRILVIALYLTTLWVNLAFSNLALAKSKLPIKKVSPRSHVTSLQDESLTIPLQVIQPFFNETRVVDQDMLKKAPYVVGNSAKRFVAIAGDEIFVNELYQTHPRYYAVVTAGQDYRDPDTKELLGIAALYVGQAQLIKTGKPAILKLTQTKSEVGNGFYLLPLEQQAMDVVLKPHPALAGLKGYIIAVLEGVTQIGRYQVVVINRGTRDSVKVADLFDIFQDEGYLVDVYQPKNKFSTPHDAVGKLLVFRTFDRVSLALIMQANNVIHVHDRIVA